MTTLKERSYPFYNSLSATALYSLGYCFIEDTCEKPIIIKTIDVTFLYVDDGNIKISFDENKITLCKGNAVFLPKDRKILISDPIKCKLVYCVFGAEEELTAIPVETPLKISVFGKTLLSRLASVTKNLYGEKYLNSKVGLETFKEYLTKPVKISENSDTEHGQIAKNCIELLVLDNIKPTYKSIKSGLGDEAYTFESEKLAEKITAYISSDFKREITLDELSEKFFFSKSYIKRVYKKHTGKGVMQARTDFKVKKAKKMIYEGKKMADISEKLGFSSVAHFSSVFKKRTGVSPTEYKKSLLLQ